MLGFRILVGCKCVIDYVVKVSVVRFFIILICNLVCKYIWYDNFILFWNFLG